MYFLNLYVIIALVYIVIKSPGIVASKLNVPRVLLPYNHDDYAANFSLKVHEGGCYKWTSSKDEVVIEEVILNNGCSKEAVVSANSRSSARLTAVVLAKDIETGISLRCDVIIDAIESLQIVTTTRQLYAEEAPEEFEVRAYDLQGNEFSTLEGQRFIWDLQTITDHDTFIPAQSVLRVIPFDLSPYETPPSIAALESVGQQGYMVLIEGVQTGLARLSVRLAHPSYKQRLSPAAVELMVIANLILEPQDVYILPHTSVTYSVTHLKQGIFHPVDLQESQYYLQVSDSSIGELESNGIEVTGLSLGSTSVILRDSLVKSSEALKQPTATFNVVEPSYLTITIQPHNNPSLIVGNHYNFIVNLFDKSNHRIYITDNIDVKSDVSGEFFAVEFISSNGTFISAVPTKTGSTKITARLTSLKISQYEEVELSPPLKASLTVEIFKKISVHPKFTFLPWDPITLPTYNVTLMVDRYNDSVSWSTSETDLVSVNRWGNCQTHGRGVAMVTVSLSMNPQNKDTAEIIIEEAIKLSLIESVVEVEVDRTLLLPIAFSTSFKDSEEYFSMCNQLPFHVTSDQPSFIALPDIMQSTTENSCAAAKLFSQRGGFATVTVSYSGSSGKLEKEAVVGAFYPLRPVAPVSASTVLALATSRMIVFAGGPLPWVKKPASHFADATVNASDDSVVAHLMQARSSSSRSDVYVVYVECHQLGIFNLTLNVGNKPSSSLPYPKTVSSSVLVICSLPEALILRPMLAVSTSCPNINGPDVTVGHCRKPISLEVEVQDGEGRRFDNISSLALNWHISEKSLASFPATSEFSDIPQLYGYSLPGKTQQDIHPHGLPGDFTVTVEISGYSTQSLHHYSLQSLQDSLQISLVGDASLRPYHLVLFNHEEIEEEIQVLGGSGHFQLINQESPFATFKYLQNEKKVMVSPLADGNVTILVQDLCLPDAAPINSSVRVSSIATLDLKIFERVEVGARIIAVGVVRDAAGYIIPAHELMNLTLHIQSNIVSISSGGVNDVGNALYNVKGLSAGDTQVKLRSQTTKSDAPLYSPMKPLQVFPPLQMIPRNVTLIVGAVFQVETKGGPYPDSSVEFYMHNETVASVSYTGIVTAMSLGTTVLTARSVAVSKEEQPMIISQDAVIINVVPLESVWIYSPLRHIESGSTMPLYVAGSENLTPLSYGTANPPLLFEWSLSNEQVAVLKTSYEQNGILETKENLGVVLFEAVKAGRVTVTVKVKVSVLQSSQKYQIKDNLILTDKIEIKIFESLVLTSPQSQDARILLTPKAQTQILTNREKEGGLTYAVDCQRGQSSTPLIEVSEGTVTANSSPGEATVLISLEKPFGVKQSIAVGVEIRSISYVLANPEVFMDPSDHSFMGYLPLGISHSLKMQFHDNRGRVFTSTNAVPEYRLSRFDMVNIRPGPTNDSLTITVRDIGQTVLKVWLSDQPAINGYLKISSGPGITPHKVSVPLGGLVCFSSNLRGPNGTKGIWESKSPGFEINRLTGVGAGHQVGKFFIAYRVTTSVVTMTEIQVVPITKISVDVSQLYISNVGESSSWFIPITLTGENSLHFPSPVPCIVPESLNIQIPFQCSLTAESPFLIDVDQMFVIYAVYLPKKGFGCEMKSVSGPDLALASNDLQLIIECVVSSWGPQKELSSGVTTLPFIPAALSDKSEIFLTSEEPSKEVVLQGKEEILTSLIVPEDHRNLHVQLGDVDKLKRHVVITAKESILSDCSAVEASEVSITSVLTHQIIKIMVHFEPVTYGQCIRREASVGAFGTVSKWLLLYQNYIIFFFCVIITSICIYFGYQALGSSGYRQTQNNTVFASRPASTASAPSVFQTSGSAFSPTGDALKRRLMFTSPSTIPLWSDDREPVYGVPVLRSSPRPAYDGSPTYSFS